MTDMALQGSPALPASKRPNLDRGFNPITAIIFFGVLAGGLLFVAYSLYVDVDGTGAKVTTYLPYLLTLPSAIMLSGFLYWCFSQIL
jgi:PiT family inorganic phosphate transporter